MDFNTFSTYRSSPSNQEGNFVAFAKRRWVDLQTTIKMLQSRCTPSNQQKKNASRTLIILLARESKVIGGKD
jgi:hypothetical protein